MNIGILKATLISISLLSLKFAEASEKPIPTFRIAIHSVNDMIDYDPIKVVDAAACLINRNMHSPLIDFDTSSGQYVSGIAEKFYWKEKEFILELRPNLKSPDNKNIITSKEVVFSLIRHFKNRPLLVPGNIHRELCQKDDIESEKDCLGIRVIDERKISFNFKFKSPRYLEYLSGCFMGIVPEYVVDNETGKISDYSNTSGPYSYSAENENYIELTANKSHWLYKTGMPLKVQILKKMNDNDKVKSYFKSGKLDFITAYSYLNNVDKEKLSKEVAGSVLHTTIKIGMASVLFTKKGMLIPIEDRLEIARVLHKFIATYRKKIGKYSSSKTQHAVPGGHGSLSVAELENLSKKLGHPKSDKMPRKVTLAAMKGNFEIAKEIFGSIDNIEFIKTDGVEPYEEQALTKKMPDLTLIAYDLNYNESFGKISGLLSGGLYPLRGQEAEEWFEMYSQLSNEERLSAFKKLNQSAVFENPSVVPLWVFSFSSLINKEWIFDSSPLSVSDNLWNIAIKQ